MSAPVQSIVHTPGPWRLNDGRKYHDGLTRVCAEGGAIALVMNRNADGNARLIVASPQMHDLLFAAVSELVALQSRFDDAIGVEPKINGVALAIEHLLDEITVA